MTNSEPTRFMRRAKTPRAAAIAGILFSILFAVSIVLMRFSIPAELTVQNEWTEAASRQFRLSLQLMPFAGIAFLWFVGVLRDRLGDFEDKFFATVTLGSGLLFLAMSFTSMSIGAGLFASDMLMGGQGLTTDLFLLNRFTISHLFNTYGLKMAAVFMFSLSTLWLRTGVMPRALSFFTYLMAIVMFVSFSLSRWMVLFFPVWVLCISIYIMVLSFSWKPSGSMDGMTPVPEAN
jgi:hypothetical protein